MRWRALAAGFLSLPLIMGPSRPAEQQAPEKQIEIPSDASLASPYALRRYALQNGLQRDVAEIISSHTDDAGKPIFDADIVINLQDHLEKDEEIAKKIVHDIKALPLEFTKQLGSLRTQTIRKSSHGTTCLHTTAFPNSLPKK